MTLTIPVIKQFSNLETLNDAIQKYVLENSGQMPTVLNGLLVVFYETRNVEIDKNLPAKITYKLKGE